VNTVLVIKLNKAIALKALGRLDESSDAYNEVLSLGREDGNAQFEIRALIGLSDLRRQQDRRDESIVLLRMAQQVAEDRNARPLLIESKQRIADIEQDNGNTEVAAAILRECFTQLVETGDRHAAMMVATNLIELYEEMELFKEAFDVSQERARIQRTVYEGEIERSLEISSVRERYAKEREAARIRDEERTKVLHAVMPAHIAARLTAGERQIVDTLPAVTIMFADVVGFTELVSSMSPEALLELLSRFFTGMDIAASRFGCERIKTVGDSYMAMCGASEAKVDHVERVVRMALSVINGEVPLPIDPSRLRIGINTGPVIAGVMDGQRISYDVWGDTVNVAARMEEHSRPGRVNCTEAVASSVAGLPGLRLIQREPLAIHGKGLMTTYWIESDQGSVI
jgi:class 3 adenylate cyclase